MQFMDQRTQLSETAEDILSQWIKNQPFHQEQVTSSNGGLSPEQADIIIAIRKRISAQKNY